MTADEYKFLSNRQNICFYNKQEINNSLFKFPLSLCS